MRRIGMRYDERALKEKLKLLNDRKGSLTMLTAIDAIVILARNSHFDNEFWEAAAEYIAHVSDRQKITKSQAVLLSLFVEETSAEKVVDLGDIASDVDCSNVTMLSYKNDVDELVQRGLLYAIRHDLDSLVNYSVPPAVIDAFAHDAAYERPSYTCTDQMELFDRFFSITHKRKKGEISTDLMLKEMIRFFDDNSGMPYVSELRKLRLTLMDEIIITQFCRHLVLSNRQFITMNNLEFLFDTPLGATQCYNALKSGRSSLLRNGYVENVCSGGFEDKEVFRLSDKLRQKLLKDYRLTLDNEGGGILLAADKIQQKSLYFADEVQTCITELSKLLEEKNYRDICQRLKQKGLRRGFACLFYGSPGTGKTESVLQLARQTGRDIVQVNISEVKSKWVGDSEKNVKAIFDRYRIAYQSSKLAPILLFNEADAIFSHRNESARHSVDKMENTMQNIILEEMEKLEGIMIATTNLEKNMDAAFERRFLYKVKFEKPAPEQRYQIWQSMLSLLSADEAQELSHRFDFSGGQIENITRRCNVQGVLYGEDSINLSLITRFCQEETLGNTYSKIGF